MKKGLMFVTALAAAALGLVACGGGGGGGTTTYTVAITNKDAIRALTDEDMSKSVSVTIDGDLQKAQDALQDGDLVISSTNESVLKISGVNKLQPVAGGKTTVKAVYKGFEDSVEITVTALPKLRVVTEPEEGKDYYFASPQGNEKVFITSHMAEGGAKFYIAATKTRDQAATVRVTNEAGGKFSLTVKDPNEAVGKVLGTASNESGGSKHYNLGFVGANVPDTEIPYAKAFFELTEDYNLQTHVDDKDLLVGSQSGKETTSLGDASKVVAGFLYEEGEAIPSTAVAIEPASGVVYVDGSLQLKANLTPANSTDSVTWRSSDPTKATVDAKTGLVKGIAVAESVTITVTTQSGKTATATVEVKGSSELNYGTKEAPLTPEQAKELIDIFEKNKNIPQKIFVSGVVSSSTAESSYEDRNIWLQSSDGETAKCFEGFGILKGDFTYVAPYEDALKGATVTMTGWAMNYNGTYEITNKNPAGSYDKGTLEAVSSAELTGIMLDKSEILVDEGADPIQLSIYPIPGYAHLDEAKALAAVWESDTPAVATVDNGLVTFVAAGEAKISATYEGLEPAECSVKVEAPAGTLVEVDFKPYAAAHTSISSGDVLNEVELDSVVTARKSEGSDAKLYIRDSDKAANWRFYNGSKMTIECAAGYEIISAKANILGSSTSYGYAAEDTVLEVKDGKVVITHSATTKYARITVRYQAVSA